MTAVRSKAIRVPLQKAEEARQLLQQQDLLRHDLAITKDASHIYYPVQSSLEKFPFGTIIEYSFERRQECIKAYQDIVAVPPSLKPLLPSSFDVVGTIALIKIPKELEPYVRQIGEAMLKVNTHLTTVCHIEPVTGELRTRGCYVIAGEQTTETTSQEYGIILTVDVASVYFSPRLSSERYRVANLVKNRECVVDLFAGVAPFSHYDS